MIHNFQVLNVNYFFHLLGRFESGRLESSKFVGELQMASGREVRLIAKGKSLSTKKQSLKASLVCPNPENFGVVQKPGCCRCRSMTYIFMAFLLRPSSREQGWTDLPASFFENWIKMKRWSNPAWICCMNPFFFPKLFWRLQKHWCIRSCFAIWKILADITLKPPDQNHCWNLPCSVQI